MPKAVQPQQFGPYLLLARLGQGGMGAVYRARDTRSNRYVALKVMSTPGADGDESVERFRREAQASIQLKHPHIVEGFEFGQAENNMWFFAMELVNGGDLASLIQKKGKMPEAEVLDASAKIASALGFAHEQHFVHRDIKPENIMYSNGEPKIADMGLVKPVAGNVAELTAAGVAMGSPHYMAPELVEEAKNATTAVDVYALGCTMYHMLTGHPVFPGNQAIEILMRHMEMAVPPPSEFGICSPGLALLLNQMTAKFPLDRLQTGSQVYAALEKLKAGQPLDGQAAPNATIAPPPNVPVAISNNPQIAAQQRAIAGPGLRPKRGCLGRMLPFGR